MSAGVGTSITVSFKGGTLVPGLPKMVTLQLEEPIPVSAVLKRLEEVIPIPDLTSRLMRTYIVVLNGKAIQHLQGWDTLVPPGSSVSVLAPMGGGSRPA
jgi:molybdopterin converting factor small subunit